MKPNIPDTKVKQEGIGVKKQTVKDHEETHLESDGTTCNAKQGRRLCGVCENKRPGYESDRVKTGNCSTNPGLANSLVEIIRK